MNNPVIQSLRKRRSQYSLGRNLSQSPAEIEALIKEAIRWSPSSFNSQSSRAVILFGAQSERFWELVRESLRPLVPAEAFGATEQKLASFAAGVGTVLFYEDQDVVKGLQEQFALYADNFPVWSEHSTGMAQVATWTALAEAGIGASLQHYNPVVDEAAAREWSIPESWKLRAQMPFGSNEAPFAEKTFIDDAERFRVVA
ncbi:nitroreductase family protein [Luteimonas arsenica]|uniref:nitroreductase family protein n=1 Tax=Luteimonas arsenica TaxID=1586242 RepID=UPI001055F3BC|nr:nitroreductase family protein [Luteimonas arsenica]